MGYTKRKIGELIRKTRKQRGFTQQDLALKLGVNRVVISDYETGKQNLTVDTIDKVAEALGVEITILFE